MNKSTKKKIGAIGLVFALCISMLATFAFFTDRETHAAGATAGNINLVWTDTSDDAAYGTADQDNTKDAVWGTASAPGTIASDIINPGDLFDMGYKLTNTGNKSIDVKQQLVLTSSVAMTADAEEYQLKIGTGSADEYQTLTPTVSNGGKTITYTLPEIVLTGTQEADTASTGIEGNKAIVGATGIDYDMYLEFSRDAANAFMGSTVSVDLDIQAKQHRNTTDTDWVDWNSYETGYEQIAG